MIDRSMLYWLHNHYGRKVLPSVSYIEAGIFYAAKAGAKTPDDVWACLEKFNYLLRRAGVIIEPQGMGEMGTAVVSALLVRQLPWGKNSHDHMIAAHARIPPRVLVTLNTADFEHLLPPDQVMNIYDVIRQWP